VGVDTVGPGIFRITVPIPFDLRDVNLYLVDTGDGFLLIDTGVATAEARGVIESSVARLGIAFCDIHTILVTPNIGLYDFGDPNPLASYLASLHRVRRVAPRRILPAHGAVLDESEVRIDELLAHHRLRLDRVASATGATGASAWSVSEHLFGDGLTPMQAWLAFFESLAHLEYLVQAGVLRRGVHPESVVYSPC
jgi:glyoxylase-like metal-dependent hydrolase (beta-lactamase superfamily II)